MDWPVTGETGGLQVRQAKVADLPAIIEFVDRCYGASAPFKGEARWRWQFLGGPYAAEADDAAPVWLALDGERVVGQIALQPGRLYLDGEARPAGWIVDVMVDPAYRGQGLSHRIHDAMVESGRTLVTLTMAPATRRIAERAGAVTLPPVYEMLRMRGLTGATVKRALHERVERRSGVVRAAARAFLGSGVGPAAVAALGRAGSAIRSRPRRHRLVVSPVDRPEFAEVGALFEAYASGQAALFDRGQAFLSWRFGPTPDLEYQFIEARNQDGRLRGLAVWRPPHPAELAVGVLADIIADPEDREAIDALIMEAVGRLDPNVEAIVAGASHPAHVQALNNLGFFALKTHHPTVVSRDPALTEALRSRPRTWHFTKGDHDWDQVLPATS